VQFEQSQQQRRRPLLLLKLWQMLVLLLHWLRQLQTLLRPTTLLL